MNLEDFNDYYLRDIRKGTHKFLTVRNDNNFFVKEIFDANHKHTIELIQVKNKLELQGIYLKKHLPQSVQSIFRNGTV